MAYTIFLVAPAAALLICVLTYAWTTLRYRLAVQSTSSLNEPATIPYLVPWLGSAQDFLDPKVGRFFTGLLHRQPRDSGACTVLLGGEKMHILHSPTAVSAMFRLKSSVANRDGFSQIVMSQACGMPPADFQIYAASQHRDHQISQEFLLRTTYAAELAVEFAHCLGDKLGAELRDLRSREGGEAGREVDLCAWLKTIQFESSLVALMGDHVMRAYPDFARDFVKFDRGFLDLVFGFSRFLKPEAYASRDKTLAGVERWIAAAEEAAGSDGIPDPREGPSWDPNWGSRCMRARQTCWKEMGMSRTGRASLELGFVFGLNSNAIPITLWMLMHILDPNEPDLLARVLAEVEPCAVAPERVAGGEDDDSAVCGIDIQRLAASPLMQSIFHETLRLYTDIMVTRELFDDVTLPLDAAGKGGSGTGRQVLLRKGTRVIAPSLMSHWDPAHFSQPPARVFSPDRYLVPSSAEKEKSVGKDGEARVFSAAKDEGRLWPWGGGKTICPGRLFAKQEVMTAVALVLLSFDITPAEGSEYKIPGLAEARPGSGGLIAGGDVRVVLRPKSRSRK